MTAREAYAKHTEGKSGYPPFDLLPPEIQIEYFTRAAKLNAQGSGNSGAFGQIISEIFNIAGGVGR